MVTAQVENYYSVIILDAHMPVMDGIQAGTRMRLYLNREKSTLPKNLHPVIYARISVPYQFSSESEKQNFDGFLKTVTPEDVTSILSLLN